MAFLHGFDFDFLPGFDDFAVSLYVKELCAAVGHGKACLAHGAEERLSGADVTDGDDLYMYSLAPVIFGATSLDQ